MSQAIEKQMMQFMNRVREVKLNTRDDMLWETLCRLYVAEVRTARTMSLIAKRPFSYLRLVK